MADEMYGSGAPLQIASGYVDRSNLVPCYDNMGFLENIDCQTIFGSRITGGTKERLLPDIKSCNRPRVWHTMGTPTVKDLVINGQFESQTPTTCKIEYKLGGFNYIRIKRDMLDDYINCQKGMIDKKTQERVVEAFAQDLDARISCSLPFQACASNIGSAAGVSGINLGTMNNPVSLTRKLSDTGKVYILDYLQYGQQVIDESGIGGEGIAVYGPMALKYYGKQAEGLRNHPSDPMQSSYFSDKFCGDLSLACGLDVYSSNCQAPVGATSTTPSKAIYRIVWFKKDRFDMAHGMIMSDMGQRDPHTTALYDTWIVRSGWAVSHREAVAVGYVTFD